MTTDAQNFEPSLRTRKQRLDLEVWRGNEKIGYLQADQAKSERGDGVPRKGSSDGPHPDTADRMRAPYSDPPL